MAILPTGPRKPWIKSNKGGHVGRIRTKDDQFYHTPAWRAVRKKYITLHPLCEECKRKHRTTAGQMVDHIKPVKQGGEKYNYSNLQTLCNKCHASKSGKEAHA